MSVHKALLLEKKFGDLVLGDIETPKPGPGEILVKVHAAALNPVDWKIKKYGFFVEKFPAVLGTDIAGEVSKLGEGVIDFAVGDRVCVYMLAKSIYVEVPAESSRGNTWTGERQDFSNTVYLPPI